MPEIAVAIEFVEPKSPQQYSGVHEALAPLDIETTIEGITFDENASNTGFPIIPPDAIGAAGPNHLVSVVNSSIEWHTKNGVQESSQSLGSFFSGLSPSGVLFDPKVIYDQFEERFLVVALERDIAAESSRILLAVSDDSDPNGTWYQQALNSVISIGGEPHWADYPGFAVDEQVVYITANMFSFSPVLFGGTRLWIIGKADLYSGSPSSVAVHDPPGVTGVSAVTMQPAHIFGVAPTGVGTFLVRYSGITDGVEEALSVIRVDDPLGSPSFTHQFVSVGNIDDTSIEVGCQ